MHPYLSAYLLSYPNGANSGFIPDSYQKKACIMRIRNYAMAGSNSASSVAKKNGVRHYHGAFVMGRRGLVLMHTLMGPFVPFDGDFVVFSSF